MLFGAHLSVSAGYEATVDYALQVGCECMQVFAKSPRQWRAKPLDIEAAGRFASLREQAGLGPLFTHTAYLINLSTTDEVLRDKSVKALAEEITRGRLLDARGVVTHIGNAPDEDMDAAALRAAASVREAFELAGPSDSPTRLLLENTAGAGRTFGGSIEELGAVIDALGESRAHVGICLDTCHAHAYGIDLGSEAAWERVLSEIDERCGPEALDVIHANDCLFGRGEHKDRHAWIGDGFLGEEAFRALICTLGDRGVCAITEMPGDIPDKDIVNIERLKALREGCA